MGTRIGTMLFALALTSLGTSSVSKEVNQDAGLAEARLVTVKPGAKRFLYWQWEIEGCPALTAKCRRKGYVLPGDILVAWSSKGTFTSVDFVSQKGLHSFGAIETAAIQPTRHADPKFLTWAGDWVRDSEAHISIKPIGKSARLRVKGDALWGTGDPMRVKNGGINTGELDGTFVPSGAWGGLLEDGSEKTDWQRAFPFNSDDNYRCQVQFRLLGPYLLVYDDGDHCGGHNVTFSGVYRKL